MSLSMRWAGLFMLAAVAAGCTSTGDVDAQPEEPETPAVEEPADEPMEDLSGLVADWEAAFTLTLPNGWTVSHCEGEAPMLCFFDGDRYVGVVELTDYPTPNDVDDADEYLEARGADFIDTMRDDRAIGCPTLTFEEIPATVVDVAGQRGLRVGFRLTDAQMREVERHSVYYTIHDGSHVTITAGAYADDGCVERLGEFTPDDLGLVQLYIDAIVANTPLPALSSFDDGAGVALTDGTHLARIVRFDPPVNVVDIELVEMLDGQAAIDAARDAGEIGAGEDLPNDFYIRDLDAAMVSIDVAGASVEVIDCSQLCERAEVGLADFLSGRRPAMNREFAIFEIEVAGGRVTHIAEIYLP